MVKYVEISHQVSISDINPQFLRELRKINKGERRKYVVVKVRYDHGLIFVEYENMTKLWA